jgi:hypothetical protein
VHCILLDRIDSFRVYGEAFGEVVEKEGFTPCLLHSRIRHLRLGSFRVVSACGKKCYACMETSFSEMVNNKF